MAAVAPVNLHKGSRDVDIWLCGKVNSKSHGARPVNQIISMMKWIRISRLPTRNSLSPHGVEISGERERRMVRRLGVRVSGVAQGVPREQKMLKGHLPPQGTPHISPGILLYEDFAMPVTLAGSGSGVRG